MLAAIVGYASTFAIVLKVLETVGATQAPLPLGALAAVAPHPSSSSRRFRSTPPSAIAVPHFIVTMAWQNVSGLTVLVANGYRPPVGAIFERLPATVTFVTAASETSFLGVGSACWGLVAGGTLLLLLPSRLLPRALDHTGTKSGPRL